MIRYILYKIYTDFYKINNQVQDGIAMVIQFKNVYVNVEVKASLLLFLIKTLISSKFDEQIQ